MTAADTLDAIALEHGLNVERRTFDGGQTIFVTVGSVRQSPTIASATADWGDEVSADRLVIDALEPILKVADAAAFRAIQGDEAQQYQALIDAGQWMFEGSIGRAMMRAIEAGECILGPRPAHDFWGTVIPAYWQVEEGTKGSITYATRLQDERG